MKQKSCYIILGTLIASLFMTTSVVFAQVSSIASNAAGRKTTAVDNFKVKADAEITRRTNSLTNLTNKISSMNRISTDTKQSLITEVQTEITNLTTLKAKIDGDASLPTLRTDVQSIVKSYRVYALFMPKIQIISASERVNTIADQILALVPKLQQHILNAQMDGQDVTAMQQALTDLQVKTSDAKIQAKAAQDAVALLTPEGYPDNITTLKSARAKLKIAVQDLSAARQDVKLIVLNQNRLKVSTASSSLISSRSATLR